ncbi:hypothetical protein CRUP_038380 [Coryphaenoides rupestris]|nr:hypothetical protein CRUP_038380 [Coryphaenoides rupestris]
MEDGELGVVEEEVEEVVLVDKSVLFNRARIRNTFYELVNKGEYNWNVKAHRDMFRSMLMTASDLGAVTKPWEVSRKANNNKKAQHVVAELVTSEFFEQGDRERSELKMIPSAIFDRNRKDELPSLQLGWIDGICSPLYETLAKLNPKLQPMVDMIQVAELVTSEFFEQGDRERSELKMIPSAIFDRNRKDELPSLQLGWIDGICSPLYELHVDLNRLRALFHERSLRTPWWTTAVVGPLGSVSATVEYSTMRVLMM